MCKEITECPYPPPPPHSQPEAHYFSKLFLMPAFLNVELGLVFGQ